MYVGNAQLDDVTAPQLAVDRGVEHGEIADAAIVLEAGANGSDMLGFKRRLWSDDLAAIPRDAGALWSF